MGVFNLRVVGWANVDSASMLPMFLEVVTGSAHKWILHGVLEKPL